MLLFGEEVIDEPDLEVPHRGSRAPFNQRASRTWKADLHIPDRGRVEDAGGGGPERYKGGEGALLMAVDVGNTQTVLGLFEGDELEGAVARLATEAQRTRRARCPLRGPARP